METVKAAGVLVQHKDKILLLKRHQNDSQPGKWGIPSGGVEEGEDFVDTAVRELEEETSLVIDNDALTDLGFFNHISEKRTFIYRVFKLVLDKEYKPELNPGEHEEFNWFTVENAVKEKDLIYHEWFVELLQKFFPVKND